MFLLKLLAHLPLPVLHGIGIALGWLIYWAPGRHSARMRNNVFDSGLCVPGRGRDRLLRQSISESGKAFVELLPMWLRPDKVMLQQVRGSSGWAHIDAARAAGRGVILIAPHIGCFEIIGQYFGARHPFTIMYKPSPQPLLNALMLAGRQRSQTRLAPTDMSGVRSLLAALKRNEGIGILPDQVASSGDGVWAPFLGRPAYTPTLVASLQRKTGAAAFFVAAERLSWGRGYHLHVSPMDDALPADKTAAALRINQGVETLVQRFPAQYQWRYNRHKCPGGVIRPVPSPAA
ncbi:MAG: lysophospholipid acyltransferase family protein [Thiobacillus sp.]|nr:lysophospholipid acyltransferase family protein [Thiobacillus sp.]